MIDIRRNSSHIYLTWAPKGIIVSFVCSVVSNVHKTLKETKAKEKTLSPRPDIEGKFCINIGKKICK